MKVLLPITTSTVSVNGEMNTADSEDGYIAPLTTSSFAIGAEHECTEDRRLQDE